MRCIVLTDRRWISPPNPNAYALNVLHEDGLVVDALQGLGVDAIRRAWDDPEVDWAQADLALFRTTWDYYRRWSEFSPWLDRVSTQVRLVNPMSLLRWNLDKRYLLDLEARGVAIVPTTIVARGDTRPLSALLDGEAVAKPVISGGGRETFRVRDIAAAEARWAGLVAAEDMMLQPFVPSILERGEISVMVIGGVPTHAVRKVARPGEFRVQDDHGGTVHPYDATPAELDAAARAVAACTPAPVYARVDLVTLPDGTPAVMELELVEPELFFRFRPDAATRLAHAVLAGAA